MYQNRWRSIVGDNVSDGSVAYVAVIDYNILKNILHKLCII